MKSTSVFVCDAVRTPFGRYGGALAHVRTDDLAAEPIRALMARNPKVDWQALDDVVYGCANQAGEDNRNVARMARATCPMASMPEPQRRFTVAAGTSIGRPASSRAMRPTLRLSSPAWLAQPYTTSSTALQSTVALRSISARIGTAPRSSVRTVDNAPP